MATAKLKRKPRLSKIESYKAYGEIRENGPFMIILHPTNNLITRILIGKKQVELLNPQVPPSKSHRILCGSSSRPLNKECIEDRRTTRGCRLEGVVWRGAPLRLFAPFLRLNGAWCTFPSPQVLAWVHKPHRGE